VKSLIIIPSYNERENIEKLIKQIFALLPDFNILVVDDNSPDGTGGLLDKIVQGDSRVKVIHRPGKLGLGTAYIEGFKYAIANNYDYVFEMDADLSHEPKYILEMQKKMEQGFDLVIGSRYLEGISVVHWDLKRLMLSLWASFYARTITGLVLTDPMSGFKCYRKKVLESIPLDKVKSNGYSFQMEMHFRAQRAGFKLAEVPIVFVDRFNGKSKMGWKIILEAALMAPRLRLGKGGDFKIL